MIYIIIVLYLNRLRSKSHLQIKASQDIKFTVEMINAML